MFNFNTDEQLEAFQYRPGQRVELKQHPGVVDVIAEYDPMMVPPIWLVNDPHPRYPEELELLSQPTREPIWFRPLNLKKRSATFLPSRLSKSKKVPQKLA